MARITLTENPQNYDVPFPEWYPNQRELAEQAVNLAEGKVLVVQSPVGSGKSTLPAVVSYFRPHTFSLMGTRELQTQYADSLPMFTILWGQEHYDCANPIWIQTIKNSQDQRITYADCPFPFYCRENCVVYEECPYELLKAKVKAARATATNYACAWHAEWWKDHCADLFADEAHTLPTHILDFATIIIDAETRKAFKLPKFPEIAQGEEYKVKTYREVAAWLFKSIRLLEPMTKHKARNRFGTWAQRVKRELEKLHDSVSGASDGLWYIQSSEAELKAEPIHPGPFAQGILIEKSRAIVLMSATIGRPDVLLRRLGLGNRKSEYISVPHPFPKANRPVFVIGKAPRISYKSGDKAYGLQATLIAGIMDSHKGEKGIIHTASWQHATRLMTLLSEHGHGNRLFLPKGNRVEKVSEFRQMSMGTVAISPSWAEGLDFVGDEGTFSVTAKIPFKPIGTPVEKLRLELPGGHDEYRQDAANKVAQQSGRIVRTPTDVGVTYIVDANWDMVKGDAPDWFETETI